MIGLKNFNTKTAAQAPSTSSHTLLVALYLVLLAFFILLNTIALTDQERSKDALRSINSSFTLNATGKDLLVKVPKPLTMDMLISQYFSDLQKLAIDHLAAETLDVVQEGKTLRMTFPVTELFVEDRALIRQEKRDFITKIAQSLSQDMQGARLELEATISTRDYLTDTPSPLYEIELLRIGSFARYLVTNRVKEDRLLMGAEPGKDKKITLTFVVRTTQ